ncbi:MAG: hypothetical protein US63_C0009G0010 [Candidatus Moranbacteria bacterium GW2011_GWC2_37_8]|nr:MAG: hypothetical protein US63_C0009G0010 [Candidatus Moranbacteria bacterium GW2011_GWC2_37_8]KKQ62262.1 MAG: hypothetical protein US82_C0016G0010 [Parcubacteria group bacterium GW2011_GWC1_38_22]KKQ81016.1 MAG: hypothetical protein UT03_C0014G0011 [Candidatus Moranbacteria bacterium GW2011_GWD2_38_7]
MHKSIGIKTRTCKKSDYAFVYGLVRKTIFPLVSQFVKPDKKIFDRRFFSDYKKTVILLRGKRRIGLYELTVNGKILTISRILLAPFYQKRGIGKYLMEYFETLDLVRYNYQSGGITLLQDFIRSWAIKSLKRKIINT